MTARLIAVCCVIACWLLLCFWAWRHARSRAQAQAHAMHALRAPAPAQTLLIAYASQTGTAEGLAQQTAESLRAGNIDVRVAELGQLDLTHLAAYTRVLFIVSTYGEGDPPDSAAAFASGAMQTAPALNAADKPALQGLQYAVLALGDSEYVHFCGFGHRLNDWLHGQGATPLFDMVDVDNGDAAALRHWQHHLGLLSGCSDLPDWQAPSYQSWHLTQRRLLNPGSQGGPCYQLELTPPADQALTWQAGDIAEIGPRLSRDGELHAHREYSIASIPVDGSVHLLVRQMRSAEGVLGLGSGWLTNTAQIGDLIDLRIRSNKNFHLPESEPPLILVGNGTGLAGLRALIKARVAQGAHRNWLIFGERNAAHDWFCHEEIAAWQKRGELERVDAVFSRDQSERRYVQHHLLDHAQQVRQWVQAGAAIYVCGSLQGMASGVDQALHHILGEELMQNMLHQGRLRRDVY